MSEDVQPIENTANPVEIPAGALPLAKSDRVSWEQKMLDEQGFSLQKIRHLKVKSGGNNEYYIFSDDNEFKTVEAETALTAIEKGEVPSPFKVVHAHCRLEDIIPQDKLEYVASDDDSGVQKNADKDIAPEKADGQG